MPAPGPGGPKTYGSGSTALVTNYCAFTQCDRYRYVLQMSCCCSMENNTDLAVNIPDSGTTGTQPYLRYLVSPASPEESLDIF
jgi:hypothetical protein